MLSWLALCWLGAIYNHSLGFVASQPDKTRVAGASVRSRSCRQRAERPGGCIVYVANVEILCGAKCIAKDNNNISS